MIFIMLYPIQFVLTSSIAVVCRLKLVCRIYGKKLWLVNLWVAVFMMPKAVYKDGIAYYQLI